MMFYCKFQNKGPFRLKNSLNSFNYAPYFLGVNDSLSEILAQNP
jgi:hypothetical protein